MAKNDATPSDVRQEEGLRLANTSRVPRRVLVVRLSALGDVAMTIPVLYSICEAYTDSQFLMLTQSVPAKLFINCPKNLQVKGIKTADYKGLGGLRRLWKEIQKEFNPDAFVDLHAVLRTFALGIFARLSGIRVEHLDKGRSGKKALTRTRNKRLLPLISSRTRYREVFQRFGIFSERYTFQSVFSGGKAEREEFSDIYSKEKGHEKWIALAPFAKHKGKIYPLEQMTKVVENLADRENTHLFLFGAGSEECTILQQWTDAHPHNVHNVAIKRYGFYKELALLSNCDVMLSMDSANMHLASLVGLRAVTIWGATHPYCGFLGWRQSEEDTVQLNLTCRPCSVFGNKPCLSGDYYCLSGITPQMILNAIDNALLQPVNR